MEQKSLDPAVDPGNGPAGRLPFAGVLRAADILSQRILLLDVQVLDGALFLTLGPDGIRNILARTDSLDGVLAVASRKPTLAESLRSILLGSDLDRTVLARFEFSALTAFCVQPLPLADRLQLRDSERLRNCPPEEVARTVAAELQAAAESDNPAHQVHEPTGPFAQLELAWSAWIDEVDSGRLSLKEWDGGFDLAAALERRVVPSGLATAGDPAVDAAVAFLSRSVYRTEALAYLSDHAAALNDREQLLRDWWMNAYFDALAAMHGTNWLRFSPDPGTQDSLPPRRFGSRRRAMGRNGATIQFQGSLVSTLHEMQPPVYALLRHQARAAIREWQRSPSQKSSDELAYAVARADAVISRRQARRTVRTRVLLTLFPVLVGTLASNITAGLVSAVAAVLLGVPLAEFLELRESGRKKMRAHIHFPAVPR
ncbi:hypothetical protein KKR91_09470 [Arthrobacter jiangjiafuii]|uniref:Uncharacterized protein n=1 Tax=Arthrobacter jiangjiafuii TaxID=2817475 RepID=A0A975QZ65_9MICC|nr:hypothetical protein [Arthrobacter jiangjiafuii]MBP3043230.1 hypothetical protein [Arthrobacter jiangjiafuii]QWC08777.1 hypothetical protein KKR91_09470 [Arthrobacter jiangjiafuii]